MIAQGLIVFATLFFLDVVWARYTTAIAERRRLAASSFGAGIIALGAYATISYIDNPLMILPAMLGAFCGTFVGIKSQPAPGVDK